ncbi:Hypothetical protein CINCED_3A008376 [Cinara cedri]|uniref:C2H2-type domain-containing protein n=1 Tax=Cinara cedri TaxID=506608 RepID=A0A5E4NRF5_9HEMI|nr:Hypothetical protein CINCED_3A008376 [Cinara cedri]
MSKHACYICRRSYPDEDGLINAFSEEGKRIFLEDKVLLLTSTLMYEHDTASNCVCKTCIYSIEFNSNFYIDFKKNYNKTLDELRSIPGNKSFVEEREVFEKTFTVREINELFSHSTTLQGKSEELKKKIQERLLQARLNQDQPILHRNNNDRVQNSHVGEINIVDDNRTKTRSSLSMRIPVTDEQAIRPKLAKLIIKRANKENTNLADNGSPQCFLISTSDIPDTVTQENKRKIFVQKNNVADNENTKNTPVPVKQEIIPEIAAGHDNNNSIVSRKVTNDQPSTSISDIDNLMVTPILTEEMTVTPDMPLPLYQEDPALHNINIPIITLPQVTQLQNSHMLTNGPTLVTPETGFHFLYASEQSVDLTHEPEKKQTEKGKKRKYQTDDTSHLVMPPPKKTNVKIKFVNMQNQPECSKPKELSPVISKMLTAAKTSSANNKTKKSKTVNLPNLPGCSKSKESSVINSKMSTAPRASSYKTRKSNKSEPKYTKSQRPKRASVTYNKQLKKSGLWKLGHQLNQKGWSVNLDRAPIHLYECCICKMMFPSIESREKHEKCHKLPEFSDEKLTETDISISSDKRDFLLSLNLVRVNRFKQNVMVRLSQDKEIIDALNINGSSIGIYKCQHCMYKTCYMFILWAHVTSVHKVLQGQKLSSFCFNCDRSLGKRTQFLKHLDKCLTNRIIINKPIKSGDISCVYCHGKVFSSKKRLNIHFMNHFPNFFMEK